MQCNRGCPISQTAWRIGDLQIFDLFNTIFEIVSKHNSETVLVVVEDNINYENLLMLSWDILHRTPAWWWKGSNLLHQKFILFMKICKNPLLVIPAHSPSYQYFGFLWKLSVLHRAGRTSAALCEKTGKPVGRGNLQGPGPGNRRNLNMQDDGYTHSHNINSFQIKTHLNIFVTECVVNFAYLQGQICTKEKQVPSSIPEPVRGWEADI